MSPARAWQTARLDPREDVVLVGVGVDDAPAQAGQGGRGLGVVAGQDLFDEGASARVGDQIEMFADPAGAREVPLELPAGRRVGEARQGEVEAGQGRTELFEKAGGHRPDARDRTALEVGEHPDEPRRPAADGRRRPGPSAPVGNDGGDRQAGVLFGEGLQGGALQVDEPGVPHGVHDLEDADDPVRCLHEEVVVVFARQGREPRFEPVEVAGQPDGVGSRRAGRGMCADVHRSPWRRLLPPPIFRTARRGPGDDRRTAAGRQGRKAGAIATGPRVRSAPGLRGGRTGDSRN